VEQRAQSFLRENLVIKNAHLPLELENLFKSNEDKDPVSMTKIRKRARGKKKKGRYL